MSAGSANAPSSRVWRHRRWRPLCSRGSPEIHALRSLAPRDGRFKWRYIPGRRSAQDTNRIPIIATSCCTFVASGIGSKALPNCRWPREGSPGRRWSSNHFCFESSLFGFCRAGVETTARLLRAMARGLSSLAADQSTSACRLPVVRRYHGMQLCTSPKFSCAVLVHRLLLLLP